MNPRDRQYALGGRLDGWVRREALDPAEASVLERVYAGRVPRTYGRFGIRQWAAPLPRTTVVVKDPFAMLSLGAIAEVTGAAPVLVYRHPAAVLASYRRMGWRADTAEFAGLGAPVPSGDDDAAAMAAFWTWLHEIALADLAGVPDSVVVSHHELTLGGDAAVDALLAELGLPVPDRTAAEEVAPAAPATRASGSSRESSDLHVFDRPAQEVAEGWRTKIPADELAVVEESTRAVWDAVQARRLRLPAPTGADPSGG